MIIIYFLNGLAFGGLGLAAYLQLRREGDFPLKKQLPWLVAFGVTCASVSWIDMFIASGSMLEYEQFFTLLRMVLQPLTGLLLLKFGWGILTHLTPLPAWTIFVPGILIVPIAYVLTYASTTFITPSPIAIPIDIWSRYLLYLPGSIIAGIGFIRQSRVQKALGFQDVSRLMLGAGMAFLFEAFVVGLIVPAAPYGPASYYNYDRVVNNAFAGESANQFGGFGLTAWLDYERVLETTGLPIQFWRLVSAVAVTFFVSRGLDVFDAIQKRKLKELQEERDRANQAAFEAQASARHTAESWTDALVQISRQITQLDNVDSILSYIVNSAKALLHSDFVGLAILEDQSNLALKCYANGSGVEFVESPTLVENSLILHTLKTARAARLEIEPSSKALDNICFGLDKPANSVAIVPLDLDNRPIGALWIANCCNEPFSETDLVWLECLADQVVITIQHGLMTSRLQTLSVVEERARIAREMHDGLAQVLGYLNLQVQTLDVLHKQGRAKAFQEELKQMRQAIKTAHADVRENILSLRTTLASQKGLVPAIQEYLEEFGIQTHIETEFSNELEHEISLSSIAEVQLVCILQEALTNVRKHALAKKVQVNLNNLDQSGNSYLCMEIVDDGVGFQEKDSRKSFGLQTMRERATGVEGEIEIHSIQGRGTHVSCRLPCLPEKKVERSLVIS
jgi:signal transduction histidine kinase